MFDISMTPDAARQIDTLLHKAPEGTKGVRLTIKTTGCSGNSYKMEYVPAEDAAENDDVIHSNGAALYIPKIYSWMLIGMQIDYTVNELGNTAFVFNNPNEVGRCGCGESFQVQPKKEDA